MRAAVIKVCDCRAGGIPITLCNRLPLSVFGGRGELGDSRDAGENQDAESGRDERNHGHFDFLLLDFLADVLRCPADHQSGDEDGQYGVEQEAVEPRAYASKDDFAGFDVE